ncbi:MAG: hypothetical protein AAFR81_19275 [Chloroflexota bacterium]
MTSVLEKEIIEKFQQLDASGRQRVLGFLEQFESERPLSAIELIRLPAEERQRRVEAAIDSAGNEEFEIFEA